MNIHRHCSCHHASHMIHHPRQPSHAYITTFNIFISSNTTLTKNKEKKWNEKLHQIEKSTWAAENLQSTELPKTNPLSKTIITYSAWFLTVFSSTRREENSDPNLESQLKVPHGACWQRCTAFWSRPRCQWEGCSQKGWLWLLRIPFSNNPHS